MRLRGTLRELAGGEREHRIEGATVLELLRSLEARHPPLRGWILDERERVRRHINVFVNGERGGEATAVRCGDRVEVLPAITGGCAVTELLVGTKKGLFVLEGEPGGRFEVRARAFAGQPVDYAMRDRRTGRLLATVTSPFYGPKIFYTDGDPTGEWQQADGVALPGGGEQALERIWVIVAGEGDGILYAGGDPGVLFESHDGGASWKVNAGLWGQPSRPHWQPGGGGLCVHSICTWPGDPDRLAIAVSAAGMWLTEDGGRTWRRGNAGLHPRYLPAEALTDENAGRCVHRVERAPLRPERLFMQFHGGVYRSDDGGESWHDIGGGGLPSDFGFPLALDPADPDSAFVIPLVADMDRVTPGGHVRVYETRDGGARWTARGGRSAGHRRLPDRAAPGLRARRARRAARALFRRHLGRGIRLARRRGELVDRGDAPAPGLLAGHRLSARADSPPRRPRRGSTLGRCAQQPSPGSSPCSRQRRRRRAPPPGSRATCAACSRTGSSARSRASPRSARALAPPGGPDRRSRSQAGRLARRARRACR